MSFLSGPACNCILFSDLNLTPNFQQWQYSNCFEKSWLGFWMVSEYQPASPPTSLYSASCLSTLKCYYRRLSFTQPWAPFGIAPPLSDPPQGFFCSMAPHEQGLLFCVIKETHIECAEMHINFQIILFRVWFDAYKYRAPSGESQDNFSFLQI